MAYKAAFQASQYKAITLLKRQIKPNRLSCFLKKKTLSIKRVVQGRGSVDGVFHYLFMALLKLLLREQTAQWTGENRRWTDMQLTSQLAARYLATHVASSSAKEVQRIHNPYSRPTRWKWYRGLAIFDRRRKWQNLKSLSQFFQHNTERYNWKSSSQSDEMDTSGSQTHNLSSIRRKGTSGS
jgi:hypothetical protein